MTYEDQLAARCAWITEAATKICAGLREERTALHANRVDFAALLEEIKRHTDDALTIKRLADEAARRIISDCCTPKLVSPRHAKPSRIRIATRDGAVAVITNLPEEPAKPL